MRLAICRFPVLFGGALAPLVLIGLALADGPTTSSQAVTLIEPQWQPIGDAQGVSWMIDQQSNVRVNSGQSLLNAVGTLSDAGGQFSPNRTLMTPDGGEYVFEGGLNSDPNGNGPALQIVRRIKIDRKSSTLRIVESVQNPGATPVQAAITENFSLRTQIQSLVSGPSGKALPVGNPAVMYSRRFSPYGNPYGGYGGQPNNGMAPLAQPPRDCGIIMRGPAGAFPSVTLYVPQTKSLKPSIQIQNSQVVQVSFTISVPPQSTVSVVWGLAERKLPAALDAKEMKRQFKTFQDSDWLADLPESVSRSIANYRRSNFENAALGPLLQPLLELASQHDVERGVADVLVHERSQTLGVVTGSDVAIDTALGKAVVPLADVALLSGGAGADRPMRAYLRNGEILVGNVEAKDLVLKSQAGIVEKLLPETIDLLFLHAAANDGKTAADAEAMLESRNGQRLLISSSGAQFHAATPWGNLDFALGDIDGLSVRREPQPVYRLKFTDGSDLSVLLQGDPPALKSLRLGPIRPAAGVWQIWSLKAPVPPRDSDEDEPAGPPGPHLRLFAENVLAGAIDSPKLNLATAGGVLAISPGQIHSAQRSGDPQEDGPFDVELTDGRHFSGRVTNRTFAVRFHGNAWELPVEHLVAISDGVRPPVADSSPGPEVKPATDAKKAAPGNGNGVPKPDQLTPTPPPTLAPPAGPTLGPQGAVTIPIFVPVSPIAPAAVPMSPQTIPAPAPVQSIAPAPTPAPAISAKPASSKPVPAKPAEKPVPQKPAAEKPAPPKPAYSDLPRAEDDDPFVPPEQPSASAQPAAPAAPAPAQPNYGDPFGGASYGVSPSPTYYAPSGQ